MGSGQESEGGSGIVPRENAALWNIVQDLSTVKAGEGGEEMGKDSREKIKQIGMGLTQGWGKRPGR